jgi:hypothetical protein
MFYIGGTEFSGYYGYFRTSFRLAFRGEHRKQALEKSIHTINQGDVDRGKKICKTKRLYAAFLRLI